MNRKQRRMAAKRGQTSGNAHAGAAAGKLLEEGLTHHQVGRLADADACYRCALEAQPGYADALHLRGLIAYQLKRYDAAADLIGQAIAHNEREPIFGTQYRELMPRPVLDRLIDRLDTWFARYEDDVLMCGRGRANVEHLGDWLIDQFPMSTPTDDTQLQIGDEVWKELPLDRTIQSIQRHKQVFSTRLHPLLCALTSAETVAYAEQSAGGETSIVSGKFRSMLIDIFGRTYPEKTFFAVDRDAVARYKARVRRNVAAVGARIEAVLRNVAVAAG